MSEDIHNFRERLEKTAETILNSEDFKPEDSKDLKNFYHYLIANNRNAGRIIKYLYHLKTMAKMFGKPFKTMAKDDIVELMSKITVGKRKDGIDWSENTKRDFRVVFKRYYQYLKGYSGSEYPPETKWIQTWLKNKVTKKPEDILTQEDIFKLADATDNSRDKAFILTIGESGLRIGEFLPLKIKNLEFNKDDNSCDIRIISEKSLKPRTVPVFTSVSALKNWLDKHPHRNDPDAYIWIDPDPKRTGKSHLAYGYMLRVLKQLAGNVGITKRVNNHAFRHASATEDGKYLNEVMLRQKYGWSRTSDMATFYIHVSSKDLREKMENINKQKANNGNGSPILKEYLQNKETIKMNKLDNVIVKLLKTIAETNPEIKEKFKQIVKDEDALDIFGDCMNSENTLRRQSHPELYILLVLGVKPDVLIKKGYSQNTVYAYNRKVKEVREKLNELLNKQI